MLFDDKENKKHFLRTRRDSREQKYFFMIIGLYHLKQDPFIIRHVMCIHNSNNKAYIIHLVQNLSWVLDVCKSDNHFKFR